ncbi:MAG: hypothetical protein A3B96_01875 [Candidatus Spechtbacteria bacterium RIFCSPHIGHO2_02_FULL_43_15b]|uniref:Uncharacterized protein n=1 Tax=Candidatus Spechtbacteria bacterium RIFCSPHIGHO2_01_FULL_43_30 TaxID=1802158 RepID=A0A1G2H7T2_9BACT|nr:MAG: hypothetical protein A2827_02235 [Candidatus Spechtbacteria bacterium RIFCSPHIGHO2_01_FULL_43_30]OGZ60132.1 MAG: hypothetical protein A3B96_01875 [Candidatus Spechtbacteria bacterium RIFCSPHIGHO2_02_FULL_43_15b]
MGLSDFYHSRFPAKQYRTNLKQYVEWLTMQGRFTPAVVDAVRLAEDKLDKKTIVFYIAGALTEADELDKERYAEISEIVSRHNANGRPFFGYAPHIYGTDPKKNPSVTPEEVRDIDYLWASVMAEVHINFLAPIAHGNAIEEGWAEAAHIPTIMCVPEKAKISRLTRGMINIHTILGYADANEIYGKVSSLILEIENWLNENSDFDVMSFFAERAYFKEFSPLCLSCKSCCLFSGISQGEKFYRCVNPKCNQDSLWCVEFTKPQKGVPDCEFPIPVAIRLHSK